METFVQKFGIDWKLMIAQLVNFAIIFFVLRAFVYKPILGILDKRRKKIEEGLTFAEKAKTELGSIETLKAEEVKKAQQKGAEMIQDAEAVANRVHEKIIADTEIDKQRLIATGKALVAEQKNRMEKDVYTQAVSLVESALGKLLGKASFKAEEKELIAQTVSEIQVK